jgi:hypothetical protein
MRLLVGDARWCFAKVLQMGKPVTKAQVRAGGEGMGPVAGDRINATYGFDGGVLGTFGTFRAPPGKEHGSGQRFALALYGSRGVVVMNTGSLPAVWYCEDPSWNPGRSKARWQEVTSAGVGKPETMKAPGLGPGNVWVVRDLIEAIEKDRQPLGSMYDGRAALEMILAVYESHRLNGPAELPLKNRQHPLGLL